MTTHDAKTLHWINAVLQNDEYSTDAELVEHFVANGLCKSDALKAVSQRDKCLMDRHYEVTL